VLKKYRIDAKKCEYFIQDIRNGVLTNKCYQTKLWYFISNSNAQNSPLIISSISSKLSAVAFQYMNPELMSNS